MSDYFSLSNNVKDIQDYIKTAKSFRNKSKNYMVKIA